MSAEIFLKGRVQLCCGDSLHFLRDQPDGRYDSVVTDPPYALVNNSGSRSPIPGQYTPIGKPKEPRGGFMGKRWDTGETAFAVEFWAEVLRALKPGGHVVAFGGTRTYHRLACAIEDAGFEIRDQLQWIYGSGFPKSHDVSKGIDRAAGAVREMLGQRTDGRYANPMAVSGRSAGIMGEVVERQAPAITAPATDAASEWQGWGTALKPACEPICLARKPLIGTVAANVLEHGTGAINVDGCRVGTTDELSIGTGTLGYHGAYGSNPGAQHAAGRWPANIIHDGSDEVIAAFPDSPGQQQDIALDAPSARTGNVYGKMNRHGEKSADSRYADKGSTNFAALPGMRRGDSGSAARFFYQAKADQDDRLGSVHPTVKPVDLMQWLVRLVTPKNGLVLDPFAGTGTTAEAAFREGMRCMLVEREIEYQTDIRRRMALILAGPDERARESIKAKIKGQPIDDGPLFTMTTQEAAE